MESYDEPPAELAVATAAPVATSPGNTASGPPAGGVSGVAAARDPGRKDAAPVRRNRRGLEYAAVAVGAVLAVVAAVALFGGSSSPDIAAAAFVTTAAQRTLAQSTADVTLSGTVHADGEDLALGGNGQVDFGTNVMALNLGASFAHGSMTETELVVGGNLYLEVTADGHDLAAVTGGRHWIEIPFAQLGSQSVTNGSAGMSLSLLTQKGARVTSLGITNIDGQTCSGYAVTPTRQGMLAGAEAEWARMGLSGAQTNAAREALQRGPVPRITAWFDSQGKLACEVTINLQVGNPAATGAEGVQLVMAFTHYGVPVTVHAPAASDTVSLPQLTNGASH